MTLRTARFRVALLVATGLLASAGDVSASFIIPLGGGWEAVIDDPGVFLVVDHVGDDVIVIEKMVIFDDIDPFTGMPAARHIAFRQVGEDIETVSRIVITDATIFNNTGLPWGGFREILVGDNVVFNPVESADFSIDPFTERTYLSGNQEVLFSGGTVAPGDVWFPGAAAGGLVIDIDLSGPAHVKFLLKELPVPTPGTIALLVIAGMVGLRTGRRRSLSAVTEQTIADLDVA